MPFLLQSPPSISIEITTEKKSVQKSNQTLIVNKDLLDNARIKNKFVSLVTEWETKTKFSSSISVKISDSSFQRIVAMGKPAIPLIIDALEKKPSNLVWALNIITGARINSTQRLTLTEACSVWVRLFRSGKVSF
jgi:LysM repeat protein